MKYNRILAAVVACVMVAAALFIGLQGKPVSRDSSLYVTDTVGVISPAAEESILVSQSRTSPRLSVAIVKSTGKLSTAAYCEALWENWRLGTGDLLLLMVTGKQDYYFGYSNSATYASLLDNNFDVLMERYLEPDFAAGNYEQAVLTFIDGLQLALMNTESFYSDEYYGTYSSSGSAMTWIVLLVVIVIIVAVVSASSIGKGTPRRVTATTYRTPTPPGTAHRATAYRPASRPASKTVYRPVPPPVSRPSTTVSRPRTTTSSRPRTTVSRSSRSGSFGGGGRSSGGFGGGGRASGGFGGGGRSGGMGGRGRR